MKYEEVVSDIKRLVGKRLRSIRPGADITLTDVDAYQQRLELTDSIGNQRSRPLAEIRQVWEELCTTPAVHVDSVLAGSGSSRNQPETILANLPYVEWLVINSRKHIALVPKPSHPSGTLKEMDGLAAHKIRAGMRQQSQDLPSAVIVTSDPRPISNCLEGLSGLQPTAPAPGIYKHKVGSREILVVNTTAIPQTLPPGTYIPLQTKTTPQGSAPVQIAGSQYHVVSRNGINFLVQSQQI